MEVIDSPAEHSSFADVAEKFQQQTQYIILGCQGSGTNLLSKFLQQFFQFSVVHDRSLIFNAAVDVSRDPAPARIREQRDFVYSRLFPGPLTKRLMLKHYYHQAKRYAGIERHFDDVEIRSAEEFANFFYAFHAKTVGGIHKAIKSDDIWEQIEHIPAVFPKRKYFLLIRDPRDNALSICNKNFGPCNMYVASEYVKQRMDIYRGETDRNPDDTMTITYESLLSKPTDVVEQVANRFGFELPDNWEAGVDELNIRATNFNKWKALPPKILSACEFMLQDTLREYGYDIMNSPPKQGTPAQIEMWRTDDTRRRAAQRVRRTVENFIHP